MRTLTVSDPSFNGIPPMLPGAMVAGDVVDLMPTVVTDSVQESRHDPAQVQPEDSVEHDPVAVSDTATLVVAA